MSRGLVSRGVLGDRVDLQTGDLFGHGHDDEQVDGHAFALRELIELLTHGNGQAKEEGFGASGNAVQQGYNLAGVNSSQAQPRRLGALQAYEGDGETRRDVLKFCQGSYAYRIADFQFKM